MQTVGLRHVRLHIRLGRHSAFHAERVAKPLGKSVAVGIEEIGFSAVSEYIGRDLQRFAHISDSAAVVTDGYVLVVLLQLFQKLVQRFHFLPEILDKCPVGIKFQSAVRDLRVSPFNELFGSDPVTYTVNDGFQWLGNIPVFMNSVSHLQPAAAVDLVMFDQFQRKKFLLAAAFGKNKRTRAQHGQTKHNLRYISELHHRAE